MGEDHGGWSLWNVKSVLFSPASFVASQRGQRAIAKPLAFFVVNLAIYLAGILAIAVIVTVRMAPSMSASGAATVGTGMAGTLARLSCTFVVSLPILIGLLFPGAAIVHLFVMMVGGQGGYAGTLRAASYASLPSLVVGLLGALLSVTLGMAGAPYFGNVAQVGGWIWGLVVLVIALRELHAVSTGAAVFAGATPVVLGILALYGLTWLLVGAILGKYTGTRSPWSMFGRVSPFSSGSRSSWGTSSSRGSTTSPGAPSSGAFRGPYVGPSGP